MLWNRYRLNLNFLTNGSGNITFVHSSCKVSGCRCPEVSFGHASLSEGCHQPRISGSFLSFFLFGSRILRNASSVADPGSGIGCLFDPCIRDPGWEKVSIRIRDPGWTTRIIFLELGNHFLFFFVLKYLNSLRIRDPGWRQFGSGIRDGKKSDSRSGMETSRIRHTDC